MKKKIQKYLAGEREGFSLVELIIVIAIMAILIGVVTLAVLPNIAKSKESKDMTALDSILSAVNNAVASQQVSTTGQFDMKISGGKATISGPSNTLPPGATASPSGAASPTTIAAEVSKLMGKSTIDLSSTNCQQADHIRCAWTFSGSTIGITVTVQDSSDQTVKGDYLGDFQVKN